MHNTGGDNPAATLAATLSVLAMDEYSKWTQFEAFSPGSDNSYSFSPILGEARVEISGVEPGMGFGYTMTYLPYGDDPIPMNSIAWTVSAQGGLVEAIRQLCRYQYVCDLGLPAPGYASAVPSEAPSEAPSEVENSQSGIPRRPPEISRTSFNVDVDYGWVPPEGSFLSMEHAGRPDQADKEWVVDHEALNIEGGLVRVNQLAIRMHSRESFPVFYDVYLVTSDLRIRKLTDTMIPLVAGGVIQMNFREEKLVEAVLSGAITVRMKVLYSADPICVDLSQPGIGAPRQGRT
jgi:hypothetical protein